MICSRCDHHLAEHCGGGCAHVSEVQLEGDGDDFTLAVTAVYCNCLGFQSEESA